MFKMCEGNHPTRIFVVRAGILRDWRGKQLVTRVPEETLLNVVAQITVDTQALYDRMIEGMHGHMFYYEECMKRCDFSGAFQTITTCKKIMQDKGLLPNTGGNVRIVQALLTVDYYKRPIQSQEATYIWKAMESCDRAWAIKEPYKIAEEPQHMDKHDDKLDASNMVLKNETWKAQYFDEVNTNTDLLTFVKQNHQNQIIHPYQRKLIMMLEASLKAEAAKLPGSRGRTPKHQQLEAYYGNILSETITREARKNPLGGNNNSMKAGYTMNGATGRSTKNADLYADVVQVDMGIVGIADTNLTLNTGAPMKNIEDVKRIRGVDASTLNDEQILNVISDVEKDKERYTKMGAASTSKTVKAKIKELDADIAALVEFLDKDADDADAAE